MTPSISHALLSPVAFDGFTLKNRVVMAPMTRARADADRTPNALMAEYYAQRASAGLIITEATTISEQANGWVASPGIYTERMVEGWKKVVDAVHVRQGVIFMQLWHCGRASHSDFHHGALPVAPSALKIDGDFIRTPKGKKEYEVPRALESAEIEEIVADYKRAAEHAHAAGFDGIEVHAANGYLLDEFLQSKTNHRTDRYGGSVENRFRLLGEVLDAILEVVPSNRVGVRLSPNAPFHGMGSPDYREQFTYTAKELNQLELAYLHVVDGLAHGFHELGAPMTLEDFRGVYAGTLIGNCGYGKDTANAAIEAGQADLIAIGLPYMSNPDLVERYANGWELAPAADMADWYSPTGAKGYTDFPRAKEAGHFGRD